MFQLGFGVVRARLSFWKLVLHGGVVSLFFLYRRDYLFSIWIGAKEGYSLIFLSNIFGMMDTEKHWHVGSFEIVGDIYPPCTL